MFDSSRIFNRTPRVDVLIRKQKWKKLRSLLKSKNAVQLINQIGAYNRTTLALAVYYDSPIDIIRTILYINPSLSLIPSMGGEIPIHIACYKGVSSEVLELLVDHDHGASARAVINNSGNSPMHCLVERICEKNTFIITGLSEASSGMTNSTSYGEDVVMHSAGSTSCNSDMSMSQKDLNRCINTLEVLCMITPEMVRCPNLLGKSPIDIVQDTKFKCESSSSKWERADIAYQVLRVANIQLYRDQKLLFELTDGKGAAFIPSTCSKSLPSLESSNASSCTNSSFEQQNKFSSSNNRY